MPDNVTAPGTGVVFASDDVGGVQFPFAKLDAGANGVSTPIIAGRKAAAASLPLVLSDEDFAVLDGLEALLIAISGKLGTLSGGRAPVEVQTLATTTRQWGPGYRAALATGAATTFAIAGNLTLGTTREVRIRASSALWLRFGTAATGQDAAIPATNGPALSMPIDANQAEAIIVPTGTTHISVIAESAAGAVTFSPAV